MCDVPTESAINVSLSWLFWRFCSKYFLVDCIFCDVVCRLFFHLFLLLEIFFFVIGNFKTPIFVFIIFVLLVPWVFFRDHIVAVFLEMSRFVTVMTLWYVRTFYMTSFLWLVPISNASCADTFVLVFCVKGFFIFSWRSWYWFLVHLVNLHLKLVTNPIHN